MLDLHAELRGIVTALDTAGIPYALVGELAVSIYAVPRATEDVNLLLDREQLLQAVERLASLGFRPAGKPMSVAGGRLDIQRLIKIDGSDLVPVDLLIPNDPALIALLAGREVTVWEGGPLSIVSLPGLSSGPQAAPWIGSGPGRSGSPGAGSVTKTLDATAAIRKASALRTLCLRLPHLPTPAEIERLWRCDALAASPDSATSADIEALAAGWRNWWRRGETERLRAMAARVPPSVINADRRLAMYACAAGTLQDR
jgi:hypothetical protein